MDSDNFQQPSSSLLFSPRKTIRHCCAASCRDLRIHWQQHSPRYCRLSCLVMPLLITWLTAILYPHPSQQSCWEFHQQMIWGLKWLLLGILSSIGFGTGLHTGILFLIPFIGDVYQMSQQCQSLDFSVWGDQQWLCQPSLLPTSATYWGLYWKTLPAVIIWGIGTALGEIPPYWISYRYRQQWQNSSENIVDKQIDQAQVMEWIIEQSSGQNSIQCWKWMIRWMLTGLQRHSISVIIFLSSYPNMFFDMCGMACGFLAIPFSHFIISTMIGKTVIKAPVQLALVLLLLSNEYLQRLLFKMSYVFPEGWVTWIETQLTGYQTQMAMEYSSSWNFSWKTLWNVFVTLLLLLFIKSCMEEKANQWKQRDRRKQE